MRTNINATVVNNVCADQFDRVIVAGVAMVCGCGHHTHSTRIYCTRASGLAGKKSALAAGKLPASPERMMLESTPSCVEQRASSRLWCSQRHMVSLASIGS